VFCSQCGKNLPDDASFCHSCGRPAAPYPIPTNFVNAAAAAAAAPAPSASSFPTSKAVPGAPYGWFAFEVACFTACAAGFVFLIAEATATLDANQFQKVGGSGMGVLFTAIWASRTWKRIQEVESERGSNFKSKHRSFLLRSFAFVSLTLLAACALGVICGRQVERQVNARRTLTDLMELNKAAHAIDVEFDNSYGGKNFLGTGCFSRPDVAGECLADTQKALDGFEGIKTRMNALRKNKGVSPNPLAVAQYETTLKLFTDTTDLYRYAAEPSRQVSVDPRDGRIRIVGVDEFNLKLNTALADQDSFRKAAKAFVEYQNKGLAQLGLKPEDWGATHYNPADFDGKAAQ